MISLIETLLGISVSVNDDQPKTVCRPCQNQLFNFMEFRNKSVEIHSTLCRTVKRCKGFPEPDAKRLLGEKREMVSQEKVCSLLDGAKQQQGEHLEKTQLVTKDLEVKAGLSAYDKNKVRHVLEICSKRLDISGYTRIRQVFHRVFHRPITC